MAGYIGSKSSVTQVDGYSEAEADAEFVNDPSSVITVSGAVVTESASAGTVEHTINNETSSGNRYSMLTFKDQGTNKYYQYQNHNDGNILFRNEHATGSLQFMTGGANERLRIDSSGNVLIGDSAPDITSKLVVSGNASADVATFMYDGSAGTYLDIDCGAANGVVELRASARSGSNPPLAFNTGGSERMRITSSGRVLVGTTTSGGSSGLTIQAGTNGSPAYLQWNKANSPSEGCMVFRFNGAAKGSVTYTSTGTAFNTTSDYRVKENVVNLTGASARLNELGVKRFNFIDDDTNTLVDGFLAHEVATVVPEAITGTKDAMMDEEYEVTPATGDIYTPATEAYVDDDGNDVDAVDEVIHSADAEQPETLEDVQQWRETTAAVMGTRSVPEYQGIDQSKLVPLLTAALQEALTEIASLKTRVEALEA